MTVLQNETAAVQPANMLWLIQRDFLQGKTVQQMVHEALLPVPNPNSDRDIEQVCPPLLVFTLAVSHVNTCFLPCQGLENPHIDSPVVMRRYGIVAS
jgi:hypothetical protein